MDSVTHCLFKIWLFLHLFRLQCPPHKEFWKFLVSSGSTFKGSTHHHQLKYFWLLELLIKIHFDPFGASNFLTCDSAETKLNWGKIYADSYSAQSYESITEYILEIGDGLFFSCSKIWQIQSQRIDGSWGNSGELYLHYAHFVESRRRWRRR